MTTTSVDWTGDFKEQEQGWASKKVPSRSLDDRVNLNGTEGRDFFLGPDAVLEFYAQARMNRKLLRPPHPSSDRTTPESAASSPAALDPLRTPSSRARGKQQRSARSRPPSSRRLFIATSPHATNSMYDDTADDTGDGVGADDDDTILLKKMKCKKVGIAVCMVYTVLHTVLHIVLHSGEVGISRNEC
ncbi:hypothetical protein JG688_00016508 [Phytophthora aleatoria]|uniref:Uncharacterized protein n=1 Tax=Phytophthora aleatoria TaxID=2496075 RepID=A0A8J5I471_9STRA|nr:hypothetical protein JG688_00016508 [Phytophthora aleatoria]